MEQKIIGLIPAKALGCLDENENVEFDNYLQTGGSFPYQTLGELQNAAAMIALTLKPEVPDKQLKDRIALRLIKISEEQRAKKLAEEQQFAAEESVKPDLIPEEPLIEEEIEEEKLADAVLEEPVKEIEYEDDDESLNPDTMLFTETDNTVNDQMEMPVDEPVFNLDDVVLPEPDINERLTKTDPDGFFLNDVVEEVKPVLETSSVIEEIKQEPVIEKFEPIKVESKTEIEVKPEYVPEAKQTKIVIENPLDTSKFFEPEKKTAVDKMFKTIEQDFDQLKYHIDKNEKKISRWLMIAYAIIIILLGLLAFSFYKFSTDIELLNKQIRELKKHSSSKLIEYQYYPDQNFRA